MAINPMAYSSKDVVLDVVRTERGEFYDVIDNPNNWNVDTRCEGWQVRDLVGLNVVSKGRFVTMKHGVTRFRITLHAYEAAVVPQRGSVKKLAGSGARWVKIDSLSGYALSTTGRKISRLLSDSLTCASGS